MPLLPEATRSPPVSLTRTHTVRSFASGSSALRSNATLPTLSSWGCLPSTRDTPSWSTSDTPILTGGSLIVIVKEAVFGGVDESVSVTVKVSPESE